MTGIDSVTFGVEDLHTARRFLDDWGLLDTGSGEEALVCATRDGTEVVVRYWLDSALPSAMERGPTLREVVWGVSDDATLNDIAN